VERLAGIGDLDRRPIEHLVRIVVKHASREIAGNQSTLRQPDSTKQSAPVTDCRGQNLTSEDIITPGPLFLSAGAT